MCKQPSPTSHTALNILYITSIVYIVMKFSPRIFLIKIGHFQETPTACPSMKENSNKIGILPYGYDLKRGKN